MSTIFTFDDIENKYDVCRGEDCMKKVFEYLTEDQIKITNIVKKKMINKRTSEMLWKEKNLLHLQNKGFEHKYTNNKDYRKVKGT